MTGVSGLPKTAPGDAAPARAGLAWTVRLLDDPRDLLHLLGADDAAFAWLRDGAGFVTSGAAVRIPVGAGSTRFHEAAGAVAATLATIRRDDGAVAEALVDVPAARGPIAVGALPFSSQPGHLVVPALVVGRTPDGRCWSAQVAPSDASAAIPPCAAPKDDPEPSSFRVEADPGRAGWERQVERALAAIEGGGVTKVVLARRVLVEADRSFQVSTVLRRLAGAHPSCFSFASGRFIGASPELLIRREGLSVLSQPTAGTVPRGASIVDDDALVAALVDSPKDAAEHRIVVDAVVDALAHWCTEVGVSSLRDVVKLASVSHLTTTVRGALVQPAPSSLDLVGALHPTPAVGGWPTAPALDLIEGLEGFDRGLYAGPVGWTNAEGDGEWAVALRCAALDGARAHLYTGAGLVAGSEPGAEWRETQAKLEPMLQALLRP